MNRAIGPFWDGNEVWLLTAGGALFAAFAPAYATAFSGFYLAIMLVLFGLIIRAVAFEFQKHDEAWRPFWQVLFFVGSLVPSLLFGVALGNCLQGVALNAHGDYIGSFFDLLGPFPLLCGLLGLSTIVLQGASWLALKTEKGTALHRRASNARFVMQIVTVVFVAIVTVVFFAMSHVSLGEGVTAPLLMFFTVLLTAALIAALLSRGSKGDIIAFIAASVVCLSLIGLFASAIFPDLIVSSGPGASIDIATAASSDYALTVMTVIACIGVPLVLVYHVIAYRIFRGRLSEDD